MTAAIVARVGVPTSRRSRSPARAVPGRSDATRGSGLCPRDLIPPAGRGPPAGRRPTAQTTTSSLYFSLVHFYDDFFLVQFHYFFLVQFHYFLLDASCPRRRRYKL